jgi:hypothetical protein
MTKSYPDLRHDAMMLAWAISTELKNIRPDDFIESAWAWKQLGDGIQYLLSFACDDWSEIEGTCQELESKDFPACFPSLDSAFQIHKKWQNFVKKVSKAEGVDALTTKDMLPSEEREKLIPNLSREQFASAGYRNGYLKRKYYMRNHSITILV